MCLGLIKLIQISVLTQRIQKEIIISAMIANKTDSHIHHWGRGGGRGVGAVVDSKNKQAYRGKSIHSPKSSLSALTGKYEIESIGVQSKIFASPLEENYLEAVAIT